jgi:glycosyltransferase involved in cell wall biosynthesis
MANLLLCMTPGVGLNSWKNIGSLNRELKPYVEYVKRGWRVKILTFDRGKTIPVLPEGIEAVSFPHYRLLWLLRWTHPHLVRWADVIKTNQSSNVHYYTKVAKCWNKPILLRCGYVQGEFLETTKGLTDEVISYQNIEAKAFKEATHCQIPTMDLAKWVIDKYEVSPDKITVVPNFVDTGLFKPIDNVIKKNNSVISIGRLASVKRFDMLIKACAGIHDINLTIVGEGPEGNSLINLARDLDVCANFTGNIANEKLPQLIQEHTLFAITSKREGHPKALIEAMSCGMPCVGVKATGIKNIINHYDNGCLVDERVESIREAFDILLRDRVLQVSLGHSARRYVENKDSFTQCFELEYNVLNSLINI